MSFLIDRVEFKNFRNYREFSFVPGKNLTVFIGDNAIGKTNVLECLQLLTTGESFRNPSSGDMVLIGEAEAKASLHALDDLRELDMTVTLGEKKSFTVNGKRKRLSEMKGIMPAVLFTPDDLEMIKGSPDLRRAAIDEIGTQLSQTYFSLKTGYEKVVRQRNLLLHDELVSEDLLDSWTESLINIGVRFYDHRVNLFERVRTRFRKIACCLVPGHEIDLVYIPSWKRYIPDVDTHDAESLMRSAIASAADEERGRMMSLVGPHRDEMVFSIDDKDTRAFGSQGQQRILVLAWKLAEVETIEEICGKTPVLLLDDVMSELDMSRRDALTSFILGRFEDDTVTRPQTFITTTDSSYFSDEMLAEAKVIYLGR